MGQNTAGHFGRDTRVIVDAYTTRDSSADIALSVNAEDHSMALFLTAFQARAIVQSLTEQLMITEEQTGNDDH